MNEQDLAKFASDSAYELGAAVAADKFAREHPNPAVGEAIIGRLAPYHRELLGCFKNAD
jgi:hypothetical protein